MDETEITLPDAPFALGSFTDEQGARFGGLVVGRRVLRLDRVSDVPSQVEDLLSDWETSLVSLGRLAEKIESRTDDSVADVGAWAIQAPLAPGKLLFAGANYKQHLLEMITGMRRGSGGDVDPESIKRELDERIETGDPMVLIGLASSMTGPFDDIILPAQGTQHDWELELALVIGRSARNVSRDDALSHVAGYVVCNDVTTRDLLFRADMPGWMDWLRAKNAKTFFPTGPWLVPSKFVDDPQSLQITLKLNGDVMQDESTADMMFNCARLIEWVSKTVELSPGDLLLTGSPAGNGVKYNRFLQPGDVMDGSITGLGAQRSRCVAEAAPQ